MLRNPRITSEPHKKEADAQDAASDAEGLCWKGSEDNEQRLRETQDPFKRDGILEELRSSKVLVGMGE
jgi:hypothetical protein